MSWRRPGNSERSNGSALLARSLLALCIGGSCCITALAAAHETSRPKRAGKAVRGAPPSQDPEREGPLPWYGWETLLSDAVSISMLLVAAESDEGPVAVIGLGIYALGGPAIHFGQGETLNGLGSVGLRLGLPAIGGLIGAQVSDGCRGYECFEGAGYGILLGMGAAVVLDAALLGYRSDDVSVTARRVVPTLSLAGGRSTLGLAGTF
jgi:hypothetical protein